MRLIRSLPNSDSGFTVVEVLVASLIGLTITALCLSATMMNRNVLGRDAVRTRLNENLRGALDIVLADGRIVGENLDSGFPALEVVSGTSDEMVMRRNLKDEVLKVCTAIAANTTVNKVFFAIAGNTQGCVYSGQTQNYNAWKAYRIAQGGSVDAFIYDSATKRGEFFRYTAEGDTGTTYYIQRSAGTWAYAYPATSSSVYILEEWRYKKVNDMLQVIGNRNAANTYNVAFGISAFDVQVLMQDGTVKQTFAATDPWASIASIQVTLTGQDSYAKKNITRTLVDKFFPRNVLSH